MKHCHVPVSVAYRGGTWAIATATTTLTRVACQAIHHLLALNETTGLSRVVDTGLMNV